MQKPMVFLPQLISHHGLRLEPVPGPRLGSAIHRNWARNKPLTEFEELLHQLVDNGKLDLDAFQLPVRVPNMSAHMHACTQEPSVPKQSHVHSLLPGCTFDMLSCQTQPCGEKNKTVCAAGTGSAFCLLGRHRSCEHTDRTR